MLKHEPMTDRDALILVTGGTGFLGSHVIERAVRDGIPVRALVRSESETSLLDEWNVEVATGSMTDVESLKSAMDGVTHVVHCAAKVGDWGPIAEYRTVNVGGMQNLIDAIEGSTSVLQFVHVSSLGVYEARDHHGTDESTPPSASGIDGYTLTKFESEQLLLDAIESDRVPATILRPGFIYGPRDRTMLPKLMEKLRSGGFAYLGSGEQLLNNIYVGNLVDAIFLALNREGLTHPIYNLSDARLVTRKEFIETICEFANLPKPNRHVPMVIARLLARVLESGARFIGKKEAPLLSQARIKFLGLNLDFNTDRAQHELGFAPSVNFQDGMSQTIEALQHNEAVRDGVVS